MGREADLSKGSYGPANTASGVPGTMGTPEAPRLPGYVLRTDVLKRGTRAFINVCGNEGIGRPFYRDVQLWTVPHGLSGPKEDPTGGRRSDKCKVYDFIVHPIALQMIGASVSFRKAVDDLAVESVSKHFNIRLDRKNLSFPDVTYKGVVTNVSYVQKMAQVSVENCGNELNEFFKNKEIIYLNDKSNEMHDCLEVSKSTELKNNELEPGINERLLINRCFLDEKFVNNEEKSDLFVDLKEISTTKKCLENCIDISSINALNAAKFRENLSCVKDEASLGMLPDYKSLQDKVSVTFIFDARKVESENVLLDVKSSKEILLKMLAVAENGLPLHYQCCLKFDKKCRFVEDGCHIDVSETNVVLTIAKAEKSPELWHAYFIGTSFQHLDVRDFTTVDNLKRELNALDEDDTSPSACQVKDGRLTKDMKAEEKELDDVPGEIVVVHERGIPRLHSILKQRSMSESSDDVSRWSSSHVSTTATSSDVESEEYEGSPVRIRPRLKKSVSFSERTDEALFVVNESVTQMHQSLKNKRRRMRKREQKHELKGTQRRFRSSSESCATQGDREFVHGMLSVEEPLTFVCSEGVIWDSAKKADCTVLGTNRSSSDSQNSGSEFVLFTDEDCATLNKGEALEENGRNNKDLGMGTPKAFEAENIHRNLEGSSGSSLESILEKTSLETCGGTRNGGTVTSIVVCKQATAIGGNIAGNMEMCSYEADIRTADDACVTALPCSEAILGNE